MIRPMYRDIRKDRLYFNNVNIQCLPKPNDGIVHLPITSLMENLGQGSSIMLFLEEKGYLDLPNWKDLWLVLLVGNFG